MKPKAGNNSTQPQRPGQSRSIGKKCRTSPPNSTSQINSAANGRQFNAAGLETWLRYIRQLALPDGKLQSAQAERVGQALLRLQRGLTGERTLVNKAEATLSYMDDPDLLAAYLLYYWPVSYTQAAYCLSRLTLPTPKAPQPEQAGDPVFRILDAGCGPGPLSAAALDWLTASRYQAHDNQTLGTDTPAPQTLAQKIELTICDLSADTLALAENILTRPNMPELDLHPIVLNLTEQPLPAGPFDLIMFGHSLNEVAAAGGDVGLLLDQARSRLTPGGRLLLLEPALLATARALISQRDRLLAAGLQLLAPCTLQAACPAFSQGPNQTCHEEFSWTMPSEVAELAAQAGLDRQTVKFAWFAFATPSGDAPGAAPVTVPTLLPIAAAQAAPDVYRVVSDPMLNKAGRLRYLLCGPGGRFPLSAPHTSQTAKAAGFFRLSRGTYLQVEQPEIRENGWGMAEATELKPV